MPHCEIGIASEVCILTMCSNFQADEDQDDEDERWGRDSDMDVVDDW